MIDVLESPEIRQRVTPITIDRYHRMIAAGVFDEWPVELLEGLLIEKMSKSELHVYLVNVLFRLLTECCSASKLLLLKEDPITIGNSEPEPDLAVVQGTLADYRYAKPTTALFIIEVAISSLAIDRAKAAAYARANIAEYWIVQPALKTTEVYRQPVDGEYQQKIDVPASTALESTALPGFVFDLDATLAV